MREKFQPSIINNKRENSVKISPEVRDLQDVFASAAEEDIKEVLLKEGHYKLENPIILDEKHNGIKIQGDLENPEKVVIDGQERTQILIIDGADAKEPINFQIEGLRITGGKTIATAGIDINKAELSNPQTWLKYTPYVNFDGAGVLIIGQACGKISHLVIDNCEAYFCGGGISIQQNYGERVALAGDYLKPVIIEDCHFSKNKAGDSGADIDVLPVSYALIKNCEFKNSQSNLLEQGSHGIITIFGDSFAEIKNCFFELADTQKLAIDYQKGKGGVEIVDNSFKNINPQKAISKMHQDITLGQTVRNISRHLPPVLKTFARNFPNMRFGTYQLSSNALVRQAHCGIRDSFIDRNGKAYFVE